MSRSPLRAPRLIGQLLVMAPPLLLWQCVRHPLSVFFWFITLPAGFILLRISVAILALSALGWGLQGPRPGLVTVVVLSTAIGLWPFLYATGSLAKAVARHAAIPFPIPPKVWEIWHCLFPVTVQEPAPATDLVEEPRPFPTLSVAEAKDALPDHLKALLTD